MQGTDKHSRYLKDGIGSGIIRHRNTNRDDLTCADKITKVGKGLVQLKSANTAILIFAHQRFKVPIGN